MEFTCESEPSDDTKASCPEINFDAYHTMEAFSNAKDSDEWKRYEEAWHVIGICAYEQLAQDDTN